MTHVRLSSHPLATAALLAAAPFVLLLAALLPAPAAAADTLVTVESRQSIALDGEEQPERKHTAQIWIGDGAVARDDAETRIVLAGDELLLISHRNRNYNRLALPVDPLDLAPPGMRQEMSQRLAAAKLGGSLVAGEETLEVGGWTARRYDLALTSEEGMTIDMVLWMSDEVEVDPAPYHRMTRALASLQVGGGDWVDQIAAVDGFPVLRETTMVSDVLTMESREEVLSVEEKDPPADVYGPPAGYEEVPLAGQQERPGDDEAEAPAEEASEEMSDNG